MSAIIRLLFPVYPDEEDKSASDAIINYNILVTEAEEKVEKHEETKFKNLLHEDGNNILIFSFVLFPQFHKNWHWYCIFKNIKFDRFKNKLTYKVTIFKGLKSG